MILVISTCKEKLSEQEFILPLQNIVKNSVVKHYKKLTERDLRNADKIIISGTAIQDFEYLEQDFSWLKNFDKPVIGICAGMQIIVKEFGLKLIKSANFGVKKVKVDAQNKICEGTFDAYFLHTKNVFVAENFEILATTDKMPAIIKHKEKQIYGCIFHPEVLNENIIRNFVAS